VGRAKALAIVVENPIFIPMTSVFFLFLAALALNNRGAQAWHISRLGPSNRFARRGGRRAHQHEATASRTSLHMLENEKYSEAPMLRGALRLGTSKPKSIVALFPGVGGSANNVAGLGKGWLEQNPDTQVIIFEEDAFSGIRALSAVWKLLPTLFNSSRNDNLSSPAVDGYDDCKLFDAARSRSNFFGDVLLSCCNDVSYALQEVLSDTGLTDENLVLAGFSQGASIAAYTGFLRGVAGIILMGGPGAPQLQLLPPEEKTTTQVCIISGDSDPLAPQEPLVSAFRPYGEHVNIIPDISHQIVNDHVELGGAFISNILAKEDKRNE